MNNVWVASDWHLWSKKQNGRHPFVSIAQLDQLISNFTSQIQPTDIFIYLGDLCDPEVADTKKLQAFISSIPGYKVLCRGDHDTEIPEFYLNIGFNDVCDICRIHSIIFSHMPVKVAPDMINIHGDSHSRKQTNLGYQHICVYDDEKTYMPVLVDNLLQNPSPEIVANAEKYQRDPEDINQGIYRTYQGDALVNISDISSKVDLYPMDEMVTGSGIYAAMDLSELQTPQQLYDWMHKNIHYGNFTRLKNDVQLLKSHSGSCHDQVYFAYPRLRQMGLNPKILFFIEYKEGESKGGMTHTLIYWKDEHSNTITWFENAWNGQQGIHDYDSIESLKNYIEDAHDRMPSSKTYPDLYFKNVPFNRFKEGMTLQELVKAIMEGDELDETTEIVYGDIILESVSGDSFKSTEVSPEFAMLVETARIEVDNDPMDEIIFDDIEDTKHWLADDDDEMTKPKHEPMAESKIEFVNDKGEEVPKVCPDCGSKVGIFLQGEPVFLCTNKKCKKYFGTVPCNLDESVRELAKAGKAVSIYRIHAVSADDEMEPAGAPFANSVNSAVANYRLEHWKSKEPPAEAYVHMPDLGYYDFRMSDEYSDSWWSPNNIPIKMVGKIKINKDWSWEWVTGYNDDGTSVQLNELAIHSEIDSDHKQKGSKSLNSFKKKVCDEGEFNYWYDKFPKELKHVRADTNCIITLWMTKDESELVAYICIEDKGKWKSIQALEVLPDYQGYGLSNGLMKYAKINGANMLFVDPNNKVATKVYKDAGWEFGKDKNRGKLQPMYLKTNINETSMLESSDQSSIDANHKQKGHKSLTDFTCKTAHRNDEGKSVQLTWYDDDKAVATVLIDTVPARDGYRWFGSLKVTKSYRGFGLGDQIVKLAISAKYKAGALAVHKDNAIAVNLYKKHGFKISTDRKSDEYYYMYYSPNQAPVMNEDAAQLQGYDRKQQEDVSKKYGIKAVGHDTPDDTPEKRVDQRREKQLKNLKKARKVKKRKAFVRKLKSKLPGNQKPQNEGVGAFGAHQFEIKVQSTRPPWISDEIVGEYKKKAEAVIEKYRKTSRNIPVPKQRFKVNPNTDRRGNLIAYEARTWGWLNTDRKESIRIDGAVPDVYYVYADTNYTLFFVSSRAKKKTVVYLMDSYISDYHEKLGSFTTDIKITDIMKNALSEDVDISDIPANYGEKNYFDQYIAAFDFENETGYKFELAENIKFIDKINESTSSSDTKLYPVYIMLMHSGTALATAIKTITQSHFSHSSISFDSSMKNMYSFGRKFDTNPFIGSFKREDIYSDFFKGKSIPYALYVVPCTKDEIALMKKRLDYFIKNATKFHYDFTGLFKNYLGIADNPEYRWFCSRFVADILNAGRPSSDPYVVEPSLMKPEDFLYTNFATYVTGGMLDGYDQKRVDQITQRILRVEEMKRRKAKLTAQNEAVDILDLDPFDPLQEAVLSYHLEMLPENALGDFINYLKSFKIRFDKNGNVLITRREYDQLDKHFRQSIRMLKAYEKANDVESVKEELCKIYYMIGLINQHYLNPANKQNKTVKSDIRKKMMDLRSVMMNVFQQHLKYVTTQDPKFNFQQYYNHSKYSSTIEIPNTVISAVGKALVTGLK